MDMLSDLPEDLKQYVLEEISQHYEIMDRHYGGQNGYLIFAKNRTTGREYAIKFYSGEPGDGQHDEPSLLTKVESKSILPIFDARQVDDDWAYFITPRRFEGNLDEVIAKGVSPREAIRLTQDILQGLAVIHQSSMVHRDLKPANIVIHESVPQIADFGSLKLVNSDDEKVTASKHSVLYRPPESFDTNEYDKKGDIYQVGCILYQLCGGYFPYDAIKHFNSRDISRYKKITDACDQSLFQDQVIQRRAQSGKLIDLNSLPPWIPKQLKTVIRQMTNANPEKRFHGVSAATVALTKAFACTNDFSMTTDGLQLRLSDRSVLFQEVDQDRFVALQDKGSGFRRIPGTEEQPLEVLLTPYL
ncbi:MAG TPA: hypothetical protein DHW36_04555 [Thalassospira sp.]|nr:hypothetical protein [Thalassospira sp.]|tara:strand:+ start:596 stop:1672 length:1077 start_codon:yes stop_codon:yes gene_type:complete